jgi:acyl carrier protein
MKTTLEITGSTQKISAPLTDAEFAAVQELLMEQLNITREQITPGADIETDLGADSLDKVEIVMQAEERFNVTIADDQAEPVRTVEDLCEVLARLLGR